ncbi:MAG: hypothetical protein WDM86_15240 [Rhizomicrobium sp.]
MVNEITVLVCADATQADAAQIYLQSAPHNYPPAGITIEQAAVFNYDATTFGGGGTEDGAHGKFVVIGRK